ncbi:MAG: NADPH-dependent 7-cyano-7-deazaguanine reductase QueF [Halieaceae bacterium]|nr:NADPH-dependent 7-cyano-7-deazaguanine reductase QueF [Halieaceae bacterium]
MLLGKDSPAPERYAPEILYPIPRRLARDELGLPAALPFHGEDVWHGWELSWLSPEGAPRSAVARFVIPATSENLVESKSFKLYLNSLNQERFEREEVVAETLAKDLSAVAGGEIEVELLAVDDPVLAPTPLPGECIDDQVPAAQGDGPDAGLLRVESAAGSTQQLYSHGLRSLCPVTAQPDWATVLLSCEGQRLEPAHLLAYIAGFRHHQEFHEQCVERMFRDLQAAGLEAFSIQALYTRRGGLDISPWRSTAPGQAPRLRSMRQ